ncbi:hypothetical protein LTR84_010264 [Exophiala bonariae]|uniref:Mitochondrial zinc maintenance protein 1, mitochondrial n=1 Tax=Exophiala bonariae TaxID=1690606 RepID=A0AAV9MWE6_9EURO|nr:hypothetical protein LTR84_010264 [Exophiala bonariae]
MPLTFAANKSYAHRLACLSLYKALLKECASLSAGAGISKSNGLSSTLQSLVRYRFRQDKNLLSIAAIGKGLDAGNEFLRLLQACVARSGTAIDKLEVILQSAMSRAEATATIKARNATFWQAASPKRLPHIEHIRRVSRKDLQRPSPNGPAIFLRPKPLSEITWPRRKVPRYLITSGIPVLKYPGPQPVLINRIIKQKWRRNYKSVEMLESLEEARNMAEHEDVWDDLVERHVSDENRGSPASQGSHVADERMTGTWQDAYHLSIRKVAATRYGNERTNAAMGEKLYKVLVDERELKEKERRAAKHERRMARKRALGYVSLSAGVDEGAVPVATETDELK